MGFLSALFGRKKETVQQQQTEQLPPQISRALDFLVDQSLSLAGQSGTRGQSIGNSPYTSGYNQAQQGTYNDYRVGGAGIGGEMGGFNPAIHNPFAQAQNFDAQQNSNYTPEQQAAIDRYQSTLPPSQRNGGLPSLVPQLSGDTYQGLEMLRNATGGAGGELAAATAGGEFLNSNPFTSAVDVAGGNRFTGAAQTAGFNPTGNFRSDSEFETGIDGVIDNITTASTKAVGDRFSQAGRTGGPGEGLALGDSVARALAPFAFGAYESQANRAQGAQEAQLGRAYGGFESEANRLLAAQESAIGRGFNSDEAQFARQLQAETDAADRGFTGFESERGRQDDSIGNLLGLQLQGAQNYLTAGQIQEEQQRRLALEPFERLGLLTDPLVAAISGAPRSNVGQSKGRTSFWQLGGEAKV